MDKLKLIKGNVKPLLMLSVLIVLFWYVLGNYTFGGWPIFFLFLVFFGFALTFAEVEDLKKENKSLKEQLDIK